MAALAGELHYDSVADSLTADEFNTWHAYRILQENERQYSIATLHALFYNLTITLVSAQSGSKIGDSDLKSVDDFLQSGDSVRSASITHEESARRAAARYGK